MYLLGIMMYGIGGPVRLLDLRRPELPIANNNNNTDNNDNTSNSN